MLPASRAGRGIAALLCCVLIAAACQRSLPDASPTGSATPAASPTAGEPTPSPTPSPSPVPPSPGQEYISYTVQQGDTLTSIALAYRVSLQSLICVNRDRYPSLDPDDPTYDPNRLEVGWTLFVWPGVSLPRCELPNDTPAPTAEPTTPGGPSVAVRNGSRTGTSVALTFDMGGRVDPALDIMALLVGRNVKATIFMTGAIIDSPNTDAGRQVLAILDGHRGLLTLGNHSYTHRDFKTLDDATIAMELQRMEAAVAAHSTLSPRPLFRPPYGTYDARVLAAVGANGYPSTVLWDIDSIDWKPELDGGPTTAQIVAKVRDNVRGGSIILFHLGGYNTLAALPGVLDVLEAKGLQPVTLPELLGL